MPSRSHEPPCIFPTLRCGDAEAMIAWLKQHIGFTEHAVHRDNGIVAHAELALGASILMLGQDRDDAYGRLVGERSGRRTDALYVAIADPDALHARLRAAGATIETPLRDTNYGSREFACRDPEGNLWSFGTYWPTPRGDGEA
ncbi:VOC family protein [Roseococcus thiosulfatophilus]|uniref:VOC family protein n=1 Tax=Roseococcus thiosulfatophilus TaxID=35813 RepID=UPI001A8D4409|nr:VOC family protein [Roseococcus thiosulfatophilus]